MALTYGTDIGTDIVVLAVISYLGHAKPFYADDDDDDDIYEVPYFD